MGLIFGPVFFRTHYYIKIHNCEFLFSFAYNMFVNVFPFYSSRRNFKLRSEYEELFQVQTKQT